MLILLTFIPKIILKIISSSLHQPQVKPVIIFALHIAGRKFQAWRKSFWSPLNHNLIAICATLLIQQPFSCLISKCVYLVSSIKSTTLTKEVTLNNEISLFICQRSATHCKFAIFLSVGELKIRGNERKSFHRMWKVFKSRFSISSLHTLFRWIRGYWEFHADIEMEQSFLHPKDIRADRAKHWSSLSSILFEKTEISFSDIDPVCLQHYNILSSSPIWPHRFDSSTFHLIEIESTNSSKSSHENIWF